MRMLFHAVVAVILLALPAAAQDVPVELISPSDARIAVLTAPRVGADGAGSFPPGTRMLRGSCQQDDRVTWCRVTEPRSGVSGWVSSEFFKYVKEDRPPPPDPGPGRPGNTLVEVFGVSGSLNVRERPSGESPRVATLSNGDRVLRGECRRIGGDEWCRVDDPDQRFHGWTAGRYLRLASERPDPPPDPGRPGNERVEVGGLSAGEALNVRERPSSDAPRVATLRNGDRVLRGECRRISGDEWCRVDDPNQRFHGWTAGRFLRPVDDRPDPDPGAPGTTRVEVYGLGSYDRLNVRERPTTDARVVTTLRNGDRVLRGECRRIGATEWCRVDDPGRFHGWTAGRYLRPLDDRPDPDPGVPGNTRVEVFGLNSYDRLNVRERPTTEAPVVTTLRNGDRVLRGECRRISGTDWCRVDEPGRFSGWTAGRYLREVGGGDPPSGGGYLEVAGVDPFDRLNIRAAPTTGSAIVNSVPNGTVLRNLGCRTTGTSSTWCNVADPAGAFSGWASSRYLRDVAGPGGDVPREPRIDHIGGGRVVVSWRDGCRATFDSDGRLLEANSPCNADQLVRSAEAVRSERDG